MKPYAVVETGGKQYRLHQGDQFNVERLEADVGSTVALGSVIALSDGNSLTVGTPAIEDAQVTAEVLDHIRGKKVIAFKRKRRKGYKKTIGHRQELTVVRIESIGGADAAAAEPVETAEPAEAQPAADETAAPSED